MKGIASLVLTGAAVFAASFAQGETVAYWPMTLDPATGGTSRMIEDASGNGYDLKVALTDAQAKNTEDIPFAYPPNGPSDVTISSCAETLNGTTIGVNAFERGTSEKDKQTSDPLVLAMGLRADFTIEGYMYVKSMKHGDNADTIIAFSGVNGTGDWIWNLTEPTKDCNTRNVVVSLRKGAAPDNGGVLATINDSEIVGGWHHYALVFKYDVNGSKSLWTFYLDGVNRGSQLMAKRTDNTQHDRFLLGGANSSSKKVFDAKFAFWRVSNEALSANEMLCHRTFDTTVAYWPMNVFSGFYNNALRDLVPDVVDARNSLTVRDSSKGGVSWLSNDIGWTTPPNPDAEIAAAGIGCPSKTMVRSGNNTTKIDGQYRPVFSATADAPVLEATKLTKSFTIEGYVRLSELPASSDNNQMFVYNTLGEKGGWCWNLYGPDANGNLAMKVLYVTGSGRPAVTLGERFRAEDFLNGWNHYALTFTPDNGKGQTEWRFYLNGRLFGKSNAMPAYDDYTTFSSPCFYMSGAPSGANAQSIRGDMTCWRVSNKALKPPAFLCGGETPVIPDDALVWTGSPTSGEWSTGTVANWEANGEAVAWTDGKDAYFDDSFANGTVNVVGEVTPASINVLADTNLKVVFNNDGSSAIGEDCTNFVKRGFGTFELNYGGNKITQLLKGNCPVEVREGCLRVTAVNSNGALGDASKGYEVKVYDHATLSLYGRNAIGNATPTVANDSVFTVYTNGTFDLSCGTDWSIQALGSLDLLGGNFVAPSTCHGLGFLMVRNRLTLGQRPDRRPYVFPAVVEQGGSDVLGGITIGRNTEFRVEDVTGDAASDGVFDCAVLARTRDGWQTAQNPCGFRKTGPGTMELNGKFLNGNDQARPTGVIAVEAGELKVNTDYRGPSKYAVAGGAYLSGTGMVSTVEFAAGAGLRVDATKADLLALTGADFAGGGTVEITGVPPEEIAKLKVRCAKITGSTSRSGVLAG